MFIFLICVCGSLFGVSADNLVETGWWDPTLESFYAIPETNTLSEREGLTATGHEKDNANPWDEVGVWGIWDYYGKQVITVTFLALYLLVTLYFKDKLVETKCNSWGKYGFQEWEFHAEPRLVAAIQSDPSMRSEFLDLFRLMKRIRDEEDDDSSSDEKGYMSQYEAELSYVNEMCPRKAFFYGMAPRHNEAVIALMRLFVAQPSPTHLHFVAKSILLSKKVNPKVWYLALLGASIERPDMLGFPLAHPLDAVPDMFVAAHLLQDDDKWRHDLNPVNRTKTNKSHSKKYKGKKKGEKTRQTRSVLDDRTISSAEIAELFAPKNDTKIKKKPTKSRHSIRKDSDDGDECLVVDGSIGKDNGIESVLWYFREDMMLNQHHLYWHQTYPVNATRHPDRRAEQFFYMHRSMLARYNAERFSNGLERTAELKIQHGAIIFEGYNSHLADINSGKFWTPRPHFTPISDANHFHDPDIVRNITVNQINSIIRRFLKGIKLGKLKSRKGSLAINNKNGRGIEPLANTLEASSLSINPLFYDAFGLHNLGHQIIGLAVDPDFQKHLPTGIMSEAAVSMRDPVFYTYHTIIDNLFEKFKETLPPYQITGGAYPLLWNGVKITGVEIIASEQNEIHTFYSQTKFPLAGGVDGSVDKGEKVDVCATHLNHEPFLFKITIDMKPCVDSKSGLATVRIMLAPRYNEHGERLKLVEQRRLIFPLDTFQVKLKVGRNVITRHDVDSSLTIPWSKSLHDFEHGPVSEAADYCGCGWPKHLYIPKGSKKGTVFDLFVMVTNFDHDFVQDSPRDLKIPEPCNSAYIFCGRPMRRYPDAKPMGYPFDRPVYQVPTFDKSCTPGSLLCSLKATALPVLEEYVATVSNMEMISILVKHVDKKSKKTKREI